MEQTEEKTANYLWSYKVETRQPSLPFEGKFVEIISKFFIGRGKNNHFIGLNNKERFAMCFNFSNFLQNISDLENLVDIIINKVIYRILTEFDDILEERHLLKQIYA